MAKKKKPAKSVKPSGNGEQRDDVGILHEPTCDRCGFEVPNDCPVGAGCPECGARLGLGILNELEYDLEDKAAEGDDDGKP